MKKIKIKTDHHTAKCIVGALINYSEWIMPQHEHYKMLAALWVEVAIKWQPKVLFTFGGEKTFTLTVAQAYAMQLALNFAPEANYEQVMFMDLAEQIDRQIKN